MATSERRKVVAKRKISYRRARLLSQAFRKLDAVSAGADRYACLTREEFDACRSLLEAIEVKLLSSRAGSRSRSFCFEGVRYYFEISSFGRVFVCSPFSGREVLAGGYFRV